jgi:GTP-binding protein
MPLPFVALVGRPNVGKSTLFNRIVGQRRAIVEDIPGTTRDRLYDNTEWNGVPFTVVDTGGLEITESRKQRAPQDEPLPLAIASIGFLEEIRRQAEVAIDEADVIIMLVDAVDGLTPADEDVADVLRRTNKPVLVAANKAESEARRQAAFEFYALGLGEVYPISALHGLGVGDLLDEVVRSLPVMEEEEEPEAIKIALVGRPNVGKSSLLNKLLGQRQRDPGHHPRYPRHLPIVGGAARAAHRHGRHPSAGARGARH